MKFNEREIARTEDDFAHQIIEWKISVQNRNRTCNLMSLEERLARLEAKLLPPEGVSSNRKPLLTRYAAIQRQLHALEQEYREFRDYRSRCALLCHSAPN
jgi:hypothetical protein